MTITQSVSPPLAVNALGLPDFISAYADYADVLELPRRNHEGVAMQCLAAILNRNGVRIRHGNLTHSLDTWTVHLSLSGCGRSTLVTLVRPILKDAGLENILRSEQWGSPQALYQEFADNPSGLFVWGELSVRLRLLSERSFGGAKQWLTDRYDNLNTPDPIKYRVTGHKSKDTPAIKFNCAPRTNILATSSDEWFFTNLATEDSAGGFLPRWMLVRADGPSKDVPTPLPVNPSLAERLVQALKHVSQIKGEADLTGILADYEQWYKLTKRRFESQPNTALATAYFNRHRIHVLKLAVVYEVSQSLSLQVSPAAWAKAKLEAQRLEETIFQLLPTGMSKTGYRITEMEELIRGNPDGILMSQFTRTFQHVPKRDRTDWLETLCQSEKITRFKRESGGGRPAVVLVHEENLSQYGTKHPEDEVFGE